ncbi:MAG: hypothetical protein F8N37_03955 [Telmatospirillum sp.]|nr:hypothetical protein [Telmatospirillum sp.]
MKKKIFFTTILSLFFCLTVPQNQSFAQQERIITVTFPEIELRNGERIVNFSLLVKGGYFPSISNIPPGWSLTINNAANLWSTIEAGAELGSSALQGPEFRALRFTISQSEIDGIKFDIHLKLDVTSDFINTREINIGMERASLQ